MNNNKYRLYKAACGVFRVKTAYMQKLSGGPGSLGPFIRDTPKIVERAASNARDFFKNGLRPGATDDTAKSVVRSGDSTANNGAPGTKAQHSAGAPAASSSDNLFPPGTTQHQIDRLNAMGSSEPAQGTTRQGGRKKNNRNNYNKKDNPNSKKNQQVPPVSDTVAAPVAAPDTGVVSGSAPYEFTPHPDGRGGFYININTNNNSGVNAMPSRSSDLEQIAPTSTAGGSMPEAQSLQDTVRSLDDMDAAHVVGGAAEAKKPGYFPWMAGAAREVGRRGKDTWNYVSDAIEKHPRTALGLTLGDLGLETQGCGLGSLINRNTPEWMRLWNGYGPAPDPRLVRDPGSRDAAAGGGSTPGIDTKTAPERSVPTAPTYKGRPVCILKDGTACFRGEDGRPYFVRKEDLD